MTSVRSSGIRPCDPSTCAEGSEAGVCIRWRSSRSCRFPTADLNFGIARQPAHTHQPGASEPGPGDRQRRDAQRCISTVARPPSQFDNLATRPSLLALSATVPSRDHPSSHTPTSQPLPIPPGRLHAHRTHPHSRHTREIAPSTSMRSAQATCIASHRSAGKAPPGCLM